MNAVNKSLLMHGILQIAGANRLGMAADIANYIHQRRGNIVTTHAVRFGRHMFTASVLFCASPSDFLRIESELSAIEEYRPQLTRAKLPAVEERHGLFCEVTVYSFDQTGIVAEIADVVAREDLDVVQLTCCTYPAPFESKEMFMTEMILEAPNRAASDRTREKLELLAQHRDWDLYWTPVSKNGIKVNPIMSYPPSRMATLLEAEAKPAAL